MCRRGLLYIATNRAIPSKRHLNPNDRIVLWGGLIFENGYMVCRNPIGHIEFGASLQDSV